VADLSLSSALPPSFDLDADVPRRSVALARSERRLAWALGAVLLFSVGVRFHDLGGRSLTHDEAWRANWSMGDDLGKARRMPPLQFLVNRWVQQFFGRSEWAVRAPYALAGAGCCVLLAAFAWRVFDPTTAFFIACAAAGHPALTVHARMVKVFSLTAFAVALLMLTGFQAAEKPTGRRVVTFALVAVPCILMSFSAALVVAAWGLLIVRAVVKARRTDAKDSTVRCATAFGCAVLLAAVIAFWYVWLSGSPYVGLVYAYNRETFHPWPTGHTVAGLAQWAASALFGAYRYATGAEDVWAPLKWIVWTGATLAVLAGWPDAWRSTRPLCLFSLILLTIALVLGASGHWPLSAQPTSIYLVPLTIVFMGRGLALLHRRLGLSIAFAFVLFLVALVPAARAARLSWPGVSIPEHIRPVLDYVRHHKRPTDGVFVYYSDEEAFRFYWRDPVTPVLFQPGEDRGHPAVFAERFESFVREHGRAWFVVAHSWGDERAEFLAALPARLALVDRFAVPSSEARLYELREDDADARRIGDEP